MTDVPKAGRERVESELANLRRRALPVWRWLVSRTRAQQARIVVVLALLTVVGFVGYGRLPAVTVTCGIAAGHPVEVPLDAPTDSWREAVTAGVASAEERESIVAACERQQDTTGNYRFNRGNGAGRRQMAGGAFLATGVLLVWLAGGRSRRNVAHGADDAGGEPPAARDQLT
jgi:hypothetical protein